MIMKNQYTFLLVITNTSTQKNTLLARANIFNNLHLITVLFHEVLTVYCLLVQRYSPL